MVMADTSEHTNAISSARLHVRSSSKLGLEVTMTAIVRPAMGSQNKRKPTDDRGTRKRIRRLAYQNARIRLRLCVCSGSTPWAQKRPLTCLRKGSRRATRRVP
eukprot:1505516-Pleurochrysis_carterae.AAC.1